MNLLRRCPSVNLHFAQVAIVVAVTAKTRHQSVCQWLEQPGHKKASLCCTRAASKPNRPREFAHGLSRLSWDLRERIVRVLRCFARLIRHALAFGPVIGIAPLASLLAKISKQRTEGSHRNQRDATSWWWRMLMRAIEQSGPAAIKFAQWGSTRRDLFPSQFCDHATRLQDRVKHGSEASTGWKLALEEVTRSPYYPGGESQTHHDMFELSFSPSAIGNGNGESSKGVKGNVQPIASGSVAQVYRGSLRKRRKKNKQNGYHSPIEKEAQNYVHESDIDENVWRDVAVKVINPKVRREIELDLYIMRAAASMLEGLPFLGLEWLAISDAVEQFGSLMERQLDCRAEAAALRQFRQDFKANNEWHVTFPEPLIATSHVLVESFENGLPVSTLVKCNDVDHHEEEAIVQLKRKVAKCGLGAFLTMLFKNNLAHGDLHPGNILIRRKVQKSPDSLQTTWHSNVQEDLLSLAAAFSADEDNFELVFLDTGIVSRLERYDQESLVYLFKSIIERDGMGAGKLMLKRCKREKCSNPDAFCRGIADVVNAVLPDPKHNGNSDARNASMGLRLSVVQVSQILGSVLGLCCTHQVLLEANFAAVVAAIGVMEGLGRSLHPDLDILKEARPIILSAVLKTGLGLQNRDLDISSQEK